jgi:pimeloyl-ACP methyl ester carboxylesterase
MAARAMVLLGTVVLGALGVAGQGYRAYCDEGARFHPDREPVARPPGLSGELQDIALTTRTGTPVLGWYVPARNGTAIVYVHGALANRSQLAPEAAALVQSGYGAVLLDMPGHGSSGGRVSWGKDDQDAVSAAVDFALSQPDVVRVGALGFSMGASVVARTAAADPRIAGVVLAGTFPTLESQVRQAFRRWGPLTEVPALWAARDGGLAEDELRIDDVVGRIAPRPSLFVSGSADETVPPAMVREVYEHAGQPKELCVVMGAGHGAYARVAGDAYYDRLRAFFRRALAPLEG